MTAWVVSVLLSPTNAPETMTATISVTCDEVNAAITTRSNRQQARLMYSAAVSEAGLGSGCDEGGEERHEDPQPVNT